MPEMPELGELKTLLRGRLAAYAAKARNPEGRAAYLAFKANRVNPQVELAIQKIENGTHGLCEDCGERIAPERLRAVPGAVRCHGCQCQFEANHGSR